MEYVIFTDGSSRGNPGPGGFAAIIVGGDRVVEIGGHEASTTNNRMELCAAIHALERIPSSSSATIYTDSSYLINGITQWVSGWKRGGWITSTKTAVLNRDLWQVLDALVLTRTVVWKHVGGHVGIAGNERCDEIATAYADEDPIELYDGPLSNYPVLRVLSISHDAEKIERRSVDSTRSRAKAYSYVSAINGEVRTHATWAECEKRVKGVRGARFRKALSREDERALVREFSQRP